MIAGYLLRTITIKLAAVNLFISATGGNKGNFTSEHAFVPGEILNHFTAEPVYYFALIGRSAGIFFAQNTLVFEGVKQAKLHSDSSVADLEKTGDQQFGADNGPVGKIDLRG